MTVMTSPASEPLRLALNEIDKRRRSSLWMTRFLLVCSILCWCATDAVVLLRGNVGLGLVFALNTVMAAVFAVGINGGGMASANTIKILNALDKLTPPQSQVTREERS
jgi:hypothetical protein